MRKFILYLTAVVFALSGCSSLDRSATLKSPHLAIGTSLKTEVVNAIGLPRVVEKDASGQREIWYYTGKPVSESYFIPLPISSSQYTPNTQMVHFTDLGAKNVIGNDPVILTCIFDQSGRLVMIEYPNK